MEDWKEEVKQESDTKEELENWRMLVPDPGNTIGRITQFKQTFYLYHLMKSLLGKAMEQIFVGMVVTVQGLPNYKKDMEKILFWLHKQDVKMDKIDCHIPCIPKLYGMPGATDLKMRSKTM